MLLNKKERNFVGWFLKQGLLNLGAFIRDKRAYFIKINMRLYLKHIQETQIEIDALTVQLDEVERLKVEAETAYVNKTMIDGADTTVELAESEALMDKAIALCGKIKEIQNLQTQLIRESIEQPKNGSV